MRYFAQRMLLVSSLSASIILSLFPSSLHLSFAVFDCGSSSAPSHQCRPPVALPPIAHRGEWTAVAMEQIRQHSLKNPSSGTLV